MRRKEMKLLLEERYERIALLETRVEAMEQLLEGYRAREKSIIDTLRDAQEKAARSVAEADARRDEIVAKADSEAARLRNEASRHADEVLSSARDESTRMLEHAEVSLRAHREAIEAFNALIERNAAEALETTRRYADFLRTHKVEPTDADAVEGGAQRVYAAAGMPETEDDPGQLMRNIYRLQNRDIPQGEATTRYFTPETEPAQDARDTGVPDWEPAGYAGKPGDADAYVDWNVFGEAKGEPPAAQLEPEGVPQAGAAEAAFAPEAADIEAWAAYAASADTPPEPSAFEMPAAYDEADNASYPAAEPEIGTADAYDAIAAFDASFGVTGEWEPESGGVPTVGALVQDGGAADDDVSLDQLLDEIIQAGD